MYRLSGTFSGKVWRFQSGKFNWAGYNNCLSVGWTYFDMRFSKVPGARLRISGRLWNLIDPGLSPGEKQEAQISLPPKIEPK
jgi:hypothetical protein